MLSLIHLSLIGVDSQVHQPSKRTPVFVLQLQKSHFGVIELFIAWKLGQRLIELDVAVVFASQPGLPREPLLGS